MANPMKLPMNPCMQRPPRRQKGIVLLVALTVLVAMSLAGVALIRSVDNTVVIAGNLAFKQSSLQVADRGSLEAITWLLTQNLIVPLRNLHWFSDPTGFTVEPGG